MDEKIQSALADILKLLTDGAQAVGTAAQAEVPVLVQEILLYRFWEAVVWGTIALTPVVLLSFAIRALWRWKKLPTNQHDADAHAAAIFGALVLSVILVVVSVAAIAQFMTAVKITVAPRLYLLEQVKTLVSGG